MHRLLVQTALLLCAPIIACLYASKRSELPSSSTFLTVGKGWLDFNQCDRRCKWLYGNNQSITGERLSINECQCHDGERKLGRIKRDNDYDPPVMPKTGG